MIRFSDVDEFGRFCLAALRMTEPEIMALVGRIERRQGRGDFADYIDYDPFHASSYIDKAPGDFVVIHGHRVGEPKPRVVVQHLF